MTCPPGLATSCQAMAWRWVQERWMRLFSLSCSVKQLKFTCSHGRKWHRTWASWKVMSNYSTVLVTVILCCCKTDGRAHACSTNRSLWSVSQSSSCCSTNDSYCCVCLCEQVHTYVDTHNYSHVYLSRQAVSSVPVVPSAGKTYNVGKSWNINEWACKFSVGCSLKELNMKPAWLEFIKKNCFLMPPPIESDVTHPLGVFCVVRCCFSPASCLLTGLADCSC